MKNRLLVALFTLVLGITAIYASENTYKIEDLYAKNMALDGKVVTVKGKVVKISSRIMNKDWIHVQDNSKSNNNKVIFTTAMGKSNVAVGDTVTATGTLKANVDLGAGYFYPVLVEKSTFSK